MRWVIGLVLILGLALSLQAGLVAFAAYVILGVYFLSRYLAKDWITSVAAERSLETQPREVGDQGEVIGTGLRDRHVAVAQENRHPNAGR